MCAVGPPNNVKTTQTTRKSATVSWTKPVYNGGDEITGYVVEYIHVKKEDEDMEEGDWTKCIMPTQYLLPEYTIADLLENQKYKIR